MVDAGADAIGGSPAVRVLDRERPDDGISLNKGQGERGVRLHLSDKRRDASWACHGCRGRTRRIVGYVDSVDQMGAAGASCPSTANGKSGSMHAVKSIDNSPCLASDLVANVVQVQPSRDTQYSVFISIPHRTALIRQRHPCPGLSWQQSRFARRCQLSSVRQPCVMEPPTAPPQSRRSRHGLHNSVPFMHLLRYLLVLMLE
jgi:hypothetical protein